MANFDFLLIQYLLMLIGFLSFQKPDKKAPVLKFQEASTKLAGSWDKEQKFSTMFKWKHCFHNDLIVFQYSKTLNKLFIDMNKYVTVSFATKKSPPEGSVIRILPVYGIDAHYTDPVKRCPNHASETDASNKGFPKVWK